jgi:hypothetical protein
VLFGQVAWVTVSWDVFIVSAPDDVSSPAEMPTDFEPAPLGAARDIRQRLQRLEVTLPKPDADGTDSAWGYLRGPTWGMEVNIGSDDPVRMVALHVRGGGDDVVPVIVAIAEAVGGRALDSSTGDFLTGDADVAGWQSFQRFRDQVIGRGQT